MDWIRETADGALLPVRAMPRASKNAIQGVHDGALKIRLTAPPIEGKANAALIKFLSKALDIPRAQITIASGETGRNKTVCFSGMSKNQLSKRIAQWI